MQRASPSTAIVLGLAAAALLAPRAGADEPAPGRAPDPVFFEEKVQPFLLATCSTSGCHGTAGAGRLLLEKAGFSGKLTLDQSERNLATVLQFVTPGAPLESRLVLKALARKDGGLPHSGDDYALRKTAAEFETLRQWIDGVELQGVPPIADAGDPVAAKRGAVVGLDGTRSRDRRGRPLAYSWSIASMPDGAAPLLKGADLATPELRCDQDGAYTLALVVRNGELESEPSTVTVRVDSQPVLLLEAERCGDVAGFAPTDDAAASQGRALAVAQDVASIGRATARFALAVPAAGPYRLYARAAAGGADAVPLSFRIDDGPEWTLAPAPGGYRFLEPEGQHAAAAAARVAGAAGSILAGGAWIRDGRFALSGSGERPAVFAFDAAPADGGAAGVRAVLRVLQPPRTGAHQAAVFFLFGLKDARNARFAGFHVGKGKAAIGRLADGVLEVLAERRLPVLPETDAELAVDLRGDQAFFLLPDGEPLVADFGSPPAGSAGLYATADAEFLRLDLLPGGGGAARTLQLGADELPPGTLARGRHVLTVSAGSLAAPRLDQVLLVRADLASGAGDDSERRLVRALYLDLLGRTPTQVESMMAVGLARADLARRLISSLEFYENWFEEELYYFLLLDNFRPKTPALLALPARLLNGQVHLRDAVRELVISQYFNARNPGNDTFVTVVLEQLLGITVQDEPELLESGKRMYDGYPASFLGRKGTHQADVVDIAMAHPAFSEQLLARHYARLLRAAPARKDLQRWATAFAADPAVYPEIVAEWIASAEYGAAVAHPRAKTDPMWIRALFVDALGRMPTFEEFRNFRNALQSLADPAPMRSVLAKVLLDSGKVPLPERAAASPAAFVAEQFQRYLGRHPTAAEASAFAAALAEPSATPALVVHAILSSAEYQSY